MIAISVGQISCPYLRKLWFEIRKDFGSQATDFSQWWLTNLVRDIDNRLKKQKIPFSYTTKNGESLKKSFNGYVLSQFISYYNIKRDKRYSYAHKIGNLIEYTYSQQASEFIVNQIKQDPARIVEKIKKR